MTASWWVRARLSAGKSGDRPIIIIRRYPHVISPLAVRVQIPVVNNYINKILNGEKIVFALERVHVRKRVKRD